MGGKVRVLVEVDLALADVLMTKKVDVDVLLPAVGDSIVGGEAKSLAMRVFALFSRILEELPVSPPDAGGCPAVKGVAETCLKSIHAVLGKNCAISNCAADLSSSFVANGARREVSDPGPSF